MATIPQFYEVLGILAGRLVKEGSPWLKLDTQRLQEQIKDPDRLAKEFVSFIANGGQLLIGELKKFAINRSVPVDVAKFIGNGWSIWKGPKDGDGLTGDEEQDARSLAVSEIDLSALRFEHCLRGNETSITGEVKVARLVETHRALIRPDIAIAHALYQEPEHVTLEWIRENLGRTWFDFPGTVLRGPRGSRYVLALYWGGDRWGWVCSWLGPHWDAKYPSFLLASEPSST